MIWGSYGVDSTYKDRLFYLSSSTICSIGPRLCLLMHFNECRIFSLFVVKFWGQIAQKLSTNGESSQVVKLNDKLDSNQIMLM